MAYTTMLKGVVPQSWKTAFWRRMPDRMVVRRNYYRRFGIHPDLDAPKTLSEKIQWLKLHDRTPLHTAVSDKILVRDHVAERVGPDILIPKILATHEVADLTPDRIHETRFVVKPNHDSGTAILCKDRQRFDWAACRAEMAEALTRKFHMAQRERQYEGIRPGILVEELIETPDGSDLTDYKFVCLNGRVSYIQVDIDRHSDHKRVMYDRDWLRLPYIMEILPGFPAPYPEDLPRPEGLERMIGIAETLARDFVLVRIDLYNVGGKIYFGEVTLTPGAGLERFEPPEVDLEYGRKLDLAALGA